MFCDLYGTIFDIRTDEESPVVWEEMCRYMNERGARFPNGHELFEQYKELMAQAQKVGEEARGPFVEVDFVPVWSRLYGLGRARVDETTAYETSTYFHQISTILLEPYPKAREFLIVLRRKGIRPVLVSNAQASYTRPDLYEHRLTGLFDRIFLSSDYGIKKPDKRFFDAALEGCRTERSHVVYLGNEIGCDVLGATKAGLDAIYLHTPLSVPGDPATHPAAVLSVEGPDYDAVLSWLCDEDVMMVGDGTDARIVPREE
ncbi:HAD family hydrolase [Alloscardovia macacae]|nr:HAD family hydrolase [Alloscardovia macacae]